MAKDIDLKYVASVLGTTNFKIIHGKTGIIMMNTNRQFSRRLKREMQKPSKKQEDFKHVSIHREFSKENYLASLDALSQKEQNELARAQRAKIIKKASKD